MSFYEEFLKYRDRYGMNQLNTDGVQGGVTQNGALFTMEYLICLLEANFDPLDEILEVHRLIQVYRSLEVLPGLTRRTPDSLEGDSMDNTGATAAFSGLFDRGIAERMKAQGENVVCTGFDEVQDPTRNSKYMTIARIVTATQVIWRPWLWASWIKSGFKPKFFWNNTLPDKFSIWGWHGRSPGHMGFIDLAATGWTTPFRWVSVLVGQFLGCFADLGNADARKLPYVDWYFLTKGTGWGQRWFWKLAYRVWVHILLKQYPNGMRDVYSMYYGDVNHPIRKYSKRYFGEK